MKTALLLLCITTASAYKVCPGVYVNLKYYDKHIVKESIRNVRDMIYNRNNNSIYFTLETNSREPRKLGYINLKDKSTGFIEGVLNATSLAIDPDNRLFVGSSDGLYMINLSKNKAIEKLPIHDDIRNIFVKSNVIYFVNSEKRAYKYDFHSVTHVSELRKHGVDKLILDDDNNIIFLHNRTPYRVKLGTQPTDLVQISHDDVIATDIAVDKNYSAYISALDGLYVYSKDRYVLDRIGELNELQKLAIVDYDPIYIEHDTLIRLVNNPRLCLGGPYWE